MAIPGLPDPAALFFISGVTGIAMNNKTTEGLETPDDSTKLHLRIKKEADHLRKYLTFDDAIQSLATYRIHAEETKKVMRRLRILSEEFAARSIEKVDALCVMGNLCADIAEDSITTSQKEKIEKSTNLSKFGAKGAQTRHRPVAQLKEWALAEAAKSHDSDIEIANKLASRIPKHLADVSKDPKRLIYDALRALKK